MKNKIKEYCLSLGSQLAWKREDGSYEWLHSGLFVKLDDHRREIESRDKLISNMRSLMLAAIKSGDWVVDGACDPDLVLRESSDAE